MPLYQTRAGCLSPCKRKYVRAQIWRFRVRFQGEASNFFILCRLPHPIVFFSLLLKYKKGFVPLFRVFKLVRCRNMFMLKLSNPAEFRL